MPPKKKGTAAGKAKVKREPGGSDETPDTKRVKVEPSVAAKEEPVQVDAVKEEPAVETSAPIVSDTSRILCPYLDTINRNLLDFDMEKECSVTLTKQNVYCCLVCGKFLQGRGKSTPAYTHSVQHGHFVFMNLGDRKAYCLPDNYEIVDSSIDDIRRSLYPQYSSEDIENIDRNHDLSRDQHGSSFLPGFLGMNNLGHTDSINAAVIALSHVRPLRDFFFQIEKYSDSRSGLVHRFGELVRKLWSAHNFKSVISPQELIHEVSASSKKRLASGEQGECVNVLNWFLQQLHVGLGGLPANPRKKIAAVPSVITDSFQGYVYMLYV